jgi:type IX secretion system PorP/SprF family membrane protein
MKMITAKPKPFAIILLLISFFIASLQSFAQQRQQFSQYMFNGLAINPAYAGADNALNLSFYNRSQWANVEGAPTTQLFSVHSLIMQRPVGAGLMIMNDKIGVHKNLQIVASTAYHLHVGPQSHLSFGLQAGITREAFDYASLGPNANNDPKVATNMVKENFLDLGAGLFFRSRTCQVGLSAPQLLPGKVTVNDSVSVNFKRSQYFLFFKYTIPLMLNVEMEPGFLVKYMQGVPVSIDVNTNFIFNKVLLAGLSYRSKESIDFLFRANVTRQLQVGYGYDHTLGSVAKLSNASHEVMIRYLFLFSYDHVQSPR